VIIVIILVCILIFKESNKEINWVNEKSDSLANNLIDNEKPDRIDKVFFNVENSGNKWIIFFKEYKLTITKLEHVPFKQPDDWTFKCHNINGECVFACSENSEIKIFKPETYEKLKQYCLNLEETEEKK
jgi:hypothetical protein